MKFKKSVEYQPVSINPPPIVPAPEPPKPAPETLSPRMLGLYCACCNNMADLFHRGTTYCRRCYDDRNRTGRLVG